MAEKIGVFFCFLWFFQFLIGVIVGDPGRDLCKIYNNGLKCAKMVSNLLPYDSFLSFNDDLARFTNEMKYLEIESSNISVLQSRSFQRTPFLSHLLLRNISLTEIEQGAFEGLEKLKLVDLSYNLFRIIPIDAFKHTKINRLNLEGNVKLEIPANGPILHARFLTSLSLKNCNVKRFYEESFGEIPNLIHLDLGQNQLKSLPDQVFSSLRHLNFLDLSGNQFTTLDVKVFKSIPTFPKFPSTVILQNNPWACDCKVAELSEWTTQNWKTGDWSQIPKLSRLKKPVYCVEPQKLPWNSEQFKKLMSTC